MAKDAFPFIIPLGLCTAAAIFWHWYILAAVFTLLTLFIAYFFRDPERVIPADPALIVSPADGRVVEIIPAHHTASGATHLGIFLSPLDVHINRSPISGRVERAEYRPGKFLAAFNPAASDQNEQNILTINTGTDQVVVKQIAGVLARRIVCWKRQGDSVTKGERIGLIKFGSRVDMLLPPSVDLVVKVGDILKGGASTIGKYHGKTG